VISGTTYTSVSGTTTSCGGATNGIGGGNGKPQGVGVELEVEGMPMP